MNIVSVTVATEQMLMKTNTTLGRLGVGEIYEHRGCVSNTDQIIIEQTCSFFSNFYTWNVTGIDRRCTIFHLKINIGLYYVSRWYITYKKTLHFGILLYPHWTTPLQLHWLSDGSLAMYKRLHSETTNQCDE